MVVTYNAFDAFLEYMGDNSIDMDGDTFKCELCTNYTFSAAHDRRTDWSATANATGNGYTNPGQNLTSVTWGQTGGTVTFDAANVTWTASGGSISATDAVVYSDTSVNDLGVCNIDFGATESAGAGTDFLINWDASGIFTGAFA